MKKRLLSLVLVIALILPNIIVPSRASASVDYLSEDLAQQFVEFFYSHDPSEAEVVFRVLTGQEVATYDIATGIFCKASELYDVAYSGTEILPDLVSPDKHYLLADMSFVLSNVSCAISIIDNYQSMLESEIAIEQVANGIDCGIGLLTLLGLGEYISPSIGFATSAIKVALKIAGSIQKKDAEELVNVYRLNLFTQYSTNQQLTQPEGAIIVGAEVGVTQEEVDAVCSKYYTYYRMKQLIDNIKASSGGTSTPTTYTITFDSNCSNVDNITRTYNTSEGTVSFPTMTRYNYTFGGWYWEPECQIPVDTFTKENHTFYAKWTPVPMYEYSISTEGVTITDFLNFKLDDNGNIITDIVIPSAIDGYPVVKIGDSAFAYRGLTSITIPGSVKEIGDSAFALCSKLKNVTLNEGLTTIGGSAFRECYNLSSIVLPDSLETLGRRVFADTKLTEIKLGSKVSNIGTLPFSDCPISQIVVGSRNAHFCSENGVLFDKDKTRLIRYPKEKKDEIYIVPDSVKIIEEEAFAFCSNLKNIELGKNVETIGDGAFLDCNSLEKMFFGGVINYLGEYAMEACDKLEEITIAGEITRIEQGTFNGCESLKKVSVLSEVTHILWNAFDGCPIESIILPKSLKRISEYAFNYGCTNEHESHHISNIYYKGNSAEWNSIDFDISCFRYTTIHYCYGTEEETTFGTRNLILTNMEPMQQNGQTIYRVGLFAAVDSLKYRSVGYEMVCTDDGATKEVTTRNVYDAVSYSNSSGAVTKTAYAFGDNTKYLFGFVEGFSEKYKDKTFKFRPFVIDLKGNKHYGNYTENVMIYTK